MNSHNQRGTARGFVAILAVAALALLSVVAFPMAASAATTTVTSTADSGAGSLRDAIGTANAAAGADTITFALPANSVIQLLSSITITDGLSLDGSATPGLDITGQGGLGTYALFIAAPAIANQDFSFNDLIFDGTAGSPAGWQGVAIDTSFGAVNNLARSLALTRITGRNINSAGLQGPVLRDFAMQPGGPVTITDSTFTNNTSTTGTLGGGGAVFIRGTSGLVTVTGSTFTGNTARSGGAIFFEGNGGGVATTSVVSSTFTGNTANGTASVPASDGEGGAIAANQIGDVTITGSTFSGNQASLDGGAVAIGSLQLSTSKVSIATSSLSGNKAKFGGGGFWTSTAQGNVSVSGSTFAGNTLSTDPADGPLGNSIALTSSGSAGLAVLSSTFDEPSAAFTSWAITLADLTAGSLAISHSTIVGPGAVGIGTLGNSTATIDHTILWSLTEPLKAIAVNVPGLPGSHTIAIDWSVSSGDPEAYLAIGAGNHFDVSSFGLGALANNGGPTLTRLPSDFSPAHNDGDPAISGAPATDQRGSGFARIVQTIDIGAVEIQTPRLAATGVTIAPRLPLTGALLVLLGLFAVAYSRRRSARAHLA